ncbi:MAG: hypothetical protein CM1200mP20_00670 [Pseudomonadota bacterium]|nr:MAG: hypothetical protein CM1200mP20_00670 [Pseudomonadota bacterium]
MNSPTRFLANGDTVLVVEFGENIDLSTSRKVTALHVTVSALELDGITALWFLPSGLWRSTTIQTVSPSRTPRQALRSTARSLRRECLRT